MILVDFFIEGNQQLSKAFLLAGHFRGFLLGIRAPFDLIYDGWQPLSKPPESAHTYSNLPDGSVICSVESFGAGTRQRDSIGGPNLARPVLKATMIETLSE